MARENLSASLWWIHLRRLYHYAHEFVELVKGLMSHLLLHYCARVHLRLCHMVHRSDLLAAIFLQASPNYKASHIPSARD